jgi:prevent-host-death family protein
MIPMDTPIVTAAEFQRKFGQVQDLALKSPVTITANGRERLVLMAVEEYHRLKRRDREVLLAGELSDGDLAAISNAEPPSEAAAFDHETK